MRTSTLLLLAGLFTACGGGGGTTVPETNTGSTPAQRAEGIFNSQCALCHGRRGDQQLSGAKLLNVSTLSREEMVAVVSNGRGAMMAYKNMLTPAEIDAVVDHAMGLRKNAP